MIQIRKNVFETNSSSSHSLVYSPNANRNHDYLMDYNLQDGVLYIGRYEGLYFGRAPFQILYSTIDKIRYAYANFIYDKTKLKELEDLVKELYPEVTRISIFEFSYDENQYKEWEENGKDIDDYCFVSHPSVGTDEPYLESWMDRYHFTLSDFITDPHYIVIVDGDEYCIWHDMKKAGIIVDNVDMEDRSKNEVV